MTNRTRSQPPAPHGPDLRDPSPDPAELYRRFLADLFGVMAYGELSAFERMSSDARFSPTLHDRTVLGGWQSANTGTLNG